MNWLPIESAPKDRTVVTVQIAGFDGNFPAFFSPGSESWFVKGLPVGTKFPVQPTRWQPLPPPPTGDA